MTFSEYQTEAWKTATFPHTNNLIPLSDRIEYTALCLAGEVGELCNKIKKIKRDDDNILLNSRATQIVDEMGDILWYLAAMCTHLKLNLEFVPEFNLDKLNKRKDEGTISGGNRNE